MRATTDIRLHIVLFLQLEYHLHPTPLLLYLSTPPCLSNLLSVATLLPTLQTAGPNHILKTQGVIFFILCYCFRQCVCQMMKRTKTKIPISLFLQLLVHRYTFAIKTGLDCMYAQDFTFTIALFVLTFLFKILVPKQIDQ